MSLSAQLFGRDSTIFKVNSFMLGGGPTLIDKLYRSIMPESPVTQVGKTDTAFQGSDYGGSIPRLYGVCAMQGSQIVWMEHNKLKEKVKKKKSGGKGGASSPTIETFTYFATFALLLCQGQTAAIKRIWCADKLIYNAGSDDLETIIASNNAAKGWTFYRGTDDQLPDPRYEAEYGVGNVPAFRGYSYIAFRDFALKDYGNSLRAAQFKVELVSDAGSEVGIAGTVYGDYVLSGNNVSFNLKPYFLSTELAELYVPGWHNDYPSSSVLNKISVYPSGRVIRSTISISDLPSGSIPPNGTSDVQGDYWINGSVFGGIPNSFNGSAGFIDKSGGLTAGVNTLGTKTIYSTYVASGVTVIRSLAVNADAVSVNGTDVCALSTTHIYIYDKDLNLISDAPFSIGYAIDTTSRFKVEGDVVRVYTGYINHRYVEYSLSAGAVTRDIEVPAELENSYSSTSVVFDGEMVIRAYGGILSKVFRVEWINLASLDVTSVSLASVISKEVSLSSLMTAADIDVSAMSQMITGYRVPGGTIRGVIEPLQEAYAFDIAQSGYKLKFVPRGQSPVMTIAAGDLAATDGSDIGDALPCTKEMDSQLPQKVTITALSAAREYASTTQSRERENTSAVNVEELKFDLVLSDDEVAQMADRRLFLRWLGRNSYSPSLPPIYQALEATDVVTVTLDYGTFTLRLTGVTYEADGRLTCTAEDDHAALYSSTAKGATAPGSDGTIPLSGPSLVVLADAPMIYETQQNSPGISTAAAGYTDGWPGCTLVRSADTGQTWADIQGYNAPGTIGFARNSLAVNSGALIYEGAGLQVDMLSGDLESVTIDQVLAGANTALYGADGRWEVIRFRDATLQTDGSYILTGLIRGDKGTEWATGLHQAGDYLVMPDDPDNAFVGMAVESIGISMLYRAVTFGGSIDDAPDQSLTYRGVNLKPLSPAYPFGSRNALGDLAVSFTRRSRFSSSWWVTGVSAPVGEASESYEIDVMSGSAVKRTITSSTPAITYTAADQTIDFGSLQTAITLRIYQISSTVGRGYPLEVTL